MRINPADPEPGDIRIVTREDGDDFTEIYGNGVWVRITESETPAKEAFEKAIRIASHYGMNRPLVNYNEPNKLIRGRWEGEGAASDNIARLIRDEMNKPLLDTTRIVFLDIDGVMCSPRAVMSSGAMGYTRYFDPVAVGFLNQLYMAAPFRIVVTSTWRKEVDMPILLAACGVLAPTHNDWAVTTEVIRGTESSMSDRPYQINQWMQDHDILELSQEDERGSYGQWRPIPGVKCLVIDDDSFEWNQWQKDCWVKCDNYDGIGLMAMQRAFDLFKVDWPAKNRAYPA